MKNKKRSFWDRGYARVLREIQKIFEKKVKKLPLNPDKDIYYIIRRDRRGQGFFSNYLWVLGHILYAKEKGYVPVVDMKNYPTLYSETTKVWGTDNSWNYYFENVSDVSLHDAYASKNIVLADFEYLSEYSERFCGKYGLPTKEAVDYYLPIIDKNIRIRPEILSSLDEDIKNIGITDKTLAVHFRGTDMNNTGTFLHYQPAGIEEYVAAARELMDKYGLEKIFVASDEKYAVDRFCEEFGRENVCVYNVYRNSGGTNSVGIHTSVEARKNHHYLLGLEVLRDAYTISMCAGFVCGYSNVANVAILWNGNKYKEVRVIEKG